MKEDKYFEEKISRALEAIKHPENFTDEELRKLLNDTKCLQACRDLLDGKEALGTPKCNRSRYRKGVEQILLTTHHAKGHTTQR